MQLQKTLDKNSTALSRLFLIAIFIVFCSIIISSDNKSAEREEPFCTNLPRGYTYEECVLGNSDIPGEYDGLPNW